MGPDFVPCLVPCHGPEALDVHNLGVHLLVSALSEPTGDADRILDLLQATLAVCVGGEALSWWRGVEDSKVGTQLSSAFVGESVQSWR